MDKTLAWSCLLVALVSLVLFTAAPWEGGSNEEDLEYSELEEEDQDQGKADQFQGGDQVREKQGGDQGYPLVQYVHSIRSLPSLCHYTPVGDQRGSSE